MKTLLNNLVKRGIGCGSAVKAVTFDARGLQFEFSHRQNLCFNICLLLNMKNQKRGRFL